jgi:formylmethanofuran--tetrahydromethanopterin N-formyltransferase
VKLNGVAIEDTFAEAFAMCATRLIITAETVAWAREAAASLSGFATSVIACGCEAGIERELSSADTPDGRPGVAVLVFAMSVGELQKQIQARVGQCVLTAAGSACFSGLEGGEPVKIGGALRFFGDGFQIAKLIGDRRFWRVPVMDGEFICDDRAGTAKAVGGGNLIIIAASRGSALEAAERAVVAMRKLPDVILPFPGGMVRSGSKVGSKYKALIASTNDAYCPTLKGQTATKLPLDAAAVLEIVIDGLTEASVREAMRAGIAAACTVGASGGLLKIDAGNYGGRLGKYRFPLREVMA